MKRNLLLICLIFMVICYADVHADDIYEVSIEMQIGESNSTVNGLITKIDENDQVVPFIENGRTLVPLRFVSTYLNVEVIWDPVSESVILRNTDTEITVSIGKTVAYVNGIRYQMDCCPILKNNRTFVPVRFIAENLQCNVTWEEDSQKVFIKREKETEIDTSDAEIQALFQDILNQNEFASYYAGYCDVALWDNPENMFSGITRETFALLRLKDIKINEYTEEEAKTIISEFLSHGDTSISLSSYGINNLKIQLENGANFGSTSNEEKLLACCDGSVLDEISIDLFGTVLPKHENVVYSIGYSSFHLFNRVNLFYPYSPINQYNLYYNKTNHKYLFTKYAEDYFDNSDEHVLKSETSLLKATKHNGKVSLYIYRKSEFDKYSGGKSIYEGVYKNTYQKGDNGYFWVCSYGIDSSAGEEN